MHSKVMHLYEKLRSSDFHRGEKLYCTPNGSPLRAFEIQHQSVVFRVCLSLKFLVKIR